MINLTPKVWQQRIMPGPPSSPDGSLKHGRFVWNPDDERVWNIGGDWNQTATSGCQEVYSYDVALDDGLGNGLGWNFELPFCAAVGGANPGNPDQVTAVWDSNRHIIWVIPGFMPANAIQQATNNLAVALTAGGNETTISAAINLVGTGIVTWPTTGAIAIINDDLADYEYILYNGLDTTVAPHKLLNVQRGFAGTTKGAHAVGELFGRANHPNCTPKETPRVSLRQTCFSLDTSAKTWKIRSKMHYPPGVGEKSSNGFYDPVNDKIIRITGAQPITVTTFSLPSLSFTQQTYSGFGANSVAIGDNDIAWDPDGRLAYIMQPGTNPTLFLKYSPDTQIMTKITGTGVPPRFATAGGSDGINCFFPKWDSINKKILWPFVHNQSSGSAFSTDDPAIDPTAPTHTCDLWIYHPTTNTWEHDAMLPGPPIFPQGNTWVFNPKENCLMGTGKTNDPGYMYLYRYASTSPAHRPIGLSTALR